MASLLDKKTFRFRIIRESIIILVVILSTYVIDQQLRAQITQVNGTIVAENDLYGLHLIHKETYDILNEQLRAIRSIHAQINQALPPTEDIRDFLNILDTYAKKHGVITSINVGTAVVSDIKDGDVALQTIAMSIDINGEVNAVRGYIAELEHLPYFFTITNIDEKRDLAQAAFRHTVIAGTLWTKPQQALTQRQQ
jgi:hypothetical protein